MDAFQNAIETAMDTIKYNNGVLVLDAVSINQLGSTAEVIMSALPSAISGNDDLENFDDRYHSLDVMRALDDGSDLAYMRVLKFANGMFGAQVYPNFSGNSDFTNLSIYQDFIVTNLSSSFVEKAQIIKTNNTLQVYSFDSQPEVLSIQGVLKSTLTCNWDMAMVILWDNLLRLTQLTQRNLIVEFGYQGNIYWGYPLSFQWQKSSNLQELVSYNLQFLVIKRTIIPQDNNQLGVIDSINTQMNYFTQA
jgi:hypothetical protein